MFTYFVPSVVITLRLTIIRVKIIMIFVLVKLALFLTRFLFMDFIYGAVQESMVQWSS